MCDGFPVIFIAQHQHFSSDRGHGNIKFEISDAIKTLFNLRTNAFLAKNFQQV